MTEIPHLEESGSAGTQQAGPAEEAPSAKLRPLEGLGLADRVDGLATTQPQGMGGDVPAQLIAGSFMQLSGDLKETKFELRNSQKKFEDTSAELSDCKIRVAVLEATVDTFFRGRYLKNLSLVVGTGLIGIGVELVLKDVKPIGHSLWVLGALLLLFGWFSMGHKGKT